MCVCVYYVRVRNLGLKVRQFKNLRVVYQTCQLIQFVTRRFLLQTVNIDCIIIQYSVCELIAPVSGLKSRLQHESCCVREQRRPSYEFHRHVVNMENPSTSFASSYEQSIKWKFSFTFPAKD